MAGTFGYELDLNLLSAKEIEEVGKDAPWYIQTLDMLFGFNGVEGQTVVSNGE